MRILWPLALAGLVTIIAACGDSSSERLSPSPSGAPTPTVTATRAPPPGIPAATPPPVEPTARSGNLTLEELPVIEFLLADGTVVPLPVEVPSRDDYSIGLSGRYVLDERGMLFHYEDDARARGFYMRNTHIDLDIAFATADFEIQEIHTMMAESLEIIRPAAGFQYAIEAPAGWYAVNGVGVGDVARLTFELR